MTKTCIHIVYTLSSRAHTLSAIILPCRHPFYPLSLSSSSVFAPSVLVGKAVKPYSKADIYKSIAVPPLHHTNMYVCGVFACKNIQHVYTCVLVFCIYYCVVCVYVPACRALKRAARGKTHSRARTPATTTTHTHSARHQQRNPTHIFNCCRVQRERRAYTIHTAQTHTSRVHTTLAHRKSARTLCTQQQQQQISTTQ